MTTFVSAEGTDVALDRAAQLAAIQCHGSQASGNPVLRRRLELQGPRERVSLAGGPHGRAPRPAATTSTRRRQGPN